MKKYLPKLIGIINVLMLLAGCVMCILWVPEAVEHITSVCAALHGMSVLVYTAFGLVSAPIFTVFVMSFGFVPAFERDSVFDRSVARLIKSIALVIFFDCIIFGILSAVIFGMGERLVSPLFVLIALMGITVSVMLLILADHVLRASELKEEVEGTI